MKELLERIKAALAKKEGGDDEAVALLTEHTSSTVAGITSNRDTAVTEAKQLRAKLKAYDGIDVEEYKTQADKIKELEDALAAKPDVEKEVKRVQEKHARELEKLSKDREALMAQLKAEKGVVHKAVGQNGLISALSKIGVEPQYMPYVLARFAPQVTISEDGEERVALIGGKPVDEVVGAWGKSDEAKYFIKAAPSTGGGANPGAGTKTGGNKTMLRSEWEALPHNERAAKIKEGVTLVDAAS